MPTLTKEQIQNYEFIDKKWGIPWPSGHLAGLVALGVELYIEPSRDGSQARLDMLDIQKDYFARFHQHVDRMYYPTLEHEDLRTIILKKGKDPFTEIMQTLKNWPSSEGYSGRMLKKDFNLSGFEKSEGGAVTPWASEFYIKSDLYNTELSFYAASIPVTDGKGGVHFDVLRDCVLAWAKRLRPVHGLAGFSVILDIGIGEYNQSTYYVYPSLQEYVGLDIQVPSGFTHRAKGVFNRIKSVNWLTVLGDEILGSLGGLAAAKSALEPDCTLHPYPGGVVIQAGPYPLLGHPKEDAMKILMPYRKVARFTKPVRFMDYKGSLFQVEEPMNAAEEALKWVSRFD